MAALTGKEVENRPQALLIASCIGLVFASAWYLVNRASKYWQLNWGFHVDLLEDCEVGPLYKTVMESNVNFWNPAGAYPFSVSKINQWLSLFVAVAFALLVFKTVVEHYQLTWNWQWFPTLILVATAAAILILLIFGRVSSFEEKVQAKLRTTEIGP